MAYVKQNFRDGDILTAAQLNHMEDGIADAAAEQVEALTNSEIDDLTYQEQTTNKEA